MGNFSAYSFSDFRSNFLVERDLDRSPQIGLGELSRSLSKVNREVADKLNRWASDISNKVQRYASKVVKRSSRNGFDGKIDVRSVPASDSKSGEAAIIIVKLDNINGVGGEIEVSVFDNNRFLVQMSDSIGKLVGVNQRTLSSRDKTANFVIGILERV